MILINSVRQLTKFQRLKPVGNTKETMSQDPIADFLTQIRNAAMANLPGIIVNYTKMRAKLANMLLDEGYIKDVQIGSLRLDAPTAFDNKFFKKCIREKKRKGSPQVIKIYLSYCGHHRRAPFIDGLKRVSKPGKRVYYSYKEMPTVCGGFGTSIVSTSSGLMTLEKAKKKGLGGEVFCDVW
jgi:small subunit ribosomal protein S8